MTYRFNNTSPIYLQLLDIFLAKILLGEWPIGEKIPSVRDIALEFSVNPNTVQKALQELERQEVLRSERTIGRFVSEDKKLLDSLRAQHTKSIVDTFVIEMKKFYSNFNDIQELIKDTWEEI